MLFIIHCIGIKNELGKPKAFLSIWHFLLWMAVIINITVFLQSACRMWRQRDQQWSNLVHQWPSHTVQQQPWHCPAAADCGAADWPVSQQDGAAHQLVPNTWKRRLPWGLLQQVATQVSVAVHGYRNVFNLIVKVLS